MVSGNEGRKNFVHKPEFSRYAFFPDKNYKKIVDYFQFNLLEKYMPLYALFKYNKFKSALLSNNISNYTTYGYERHDDKWDTIANPPCDIMKREFFKPHQVDGIYSSLNTLKELCHKHNILLVCIQTPVYKVLHDDVYFDHSRMVCVKLDIPFFDMNSPNIRNNINFFYNSNHLNYDGIQAMNKALMHDSNFNLIIGQAIKK